MEKKYINLFDFLLKTSCDVFYFNSELCSRDKLLEFFYPYNGIISDFSCDFEKSSNKTIIFSDGKNKVIAKPRGFIVSGKLKECK